MMEQIKSCLLQFLLEINDNLNLNLSFTDMENKEKIEKAVIQNIYAGIVATGNNAVVSTNNSNVIGGQNNTISLSNDLRKKIEDIIPKITEIAQLLSNEQDEITTELVRINTQLNKNQPKMSVIGSAFQTIYSVLCSVAGNVATPIVLNNIQSIIKASGI
jgi:shikimate kinase